MIYFYSFLLYLVQPFIWCRLLFRSLKAPAYRQRWQERYGFCRHKVKANGILIHAVSVGETLAAIPLINALQQQYPELPITVTTMTPTGSERVSTLLGERVCHVYLPYDLPCAMQRFLNILQPTLVIIMETELWPNLIRHLHKKTIPLIIANARLSDKSFRQYAQINRFIRKILQQISLVAVQNALDGQRFLELGLPKSHLAVIGSLKFDISLSDADRKQITLLRNTWQLTRPVLIAASTHSGEEELILRAFARLLRTHPNLLLILVPRHPERFKDVEKLVSAHHFTYQLRSQKQVPVDETQIVIGDTMGELMLLYGLADIAFMGGSLIPHGGHNPLEPALHKLAIISGPHTFNFAVIYHQLYKNGALAISSSETETLYSICNQLISCPEKASVMGNKAALTLKQNQGTIQRLLLLIQGYLDDKPQQQ